VLTTLYLIFNAGYGPPVRAGLCAEAIRLARLLVALMPDEGEAIGLLALMLLQDSRRAARVDADGALVLLADQDRSLWDTAQIAEGERLVARGWTLGRVGVYLIQASIAVEHARGSSWARIAWLYDQLWAVSPTPVVALNRAVAIAERDGPEAGLAELATIRDLDGYHLFHATRADLLRRLHRTEEAAAAYGAALTLTESAVEREFLRARIEEISCKGPE
jgi:RNA polymerase sigma-70 factor (ECF subfamily)